LEGFSFFSAFPQCHRASAGVGHVAWCLMRRLFLWATLLATAWAAAKQDWIAWKDGKNQGAVNGCLQKCGASLWFHGDLAKTHGSFDGDVSSRARDVFLVIPRWKWIEHADH